MKEDLELAEYLRTYDQANAELKAGTDEMVPDAVVDRLAAGAPPLRMWREYRGLSQQALAGCNPPSAPATLPLAG